MGLRTHRLTVAAFGSSRGGFSRVDEPDINNKPRGVLDRGSLHRATLDVTSGTTAVSIKVEALPGQLIAASTPAVSTQVPALALSGDGVATLGSPRRYRR